MNSCRICQRHDDHPRFTAREMMFGFRDQFTYFECTGCCCVQIERVPDQLDKYYPNRYYSFQKPGRLSAYLKRERAKYAFYQRGLIGGVMSHCLGAQAAIESVKRVKPPLDAAILDVGSGNGELLLFLSALGFRDLTGADPYLEGDEAPAPGIKLLQRALAHVDGRFDVIMMHHSFEHVQDPVRAVGEIKRLLKPGGVAIIRVPVAGSYAWKKYGVNWVGLDPPRHVFVPSVQSMTMLSKHHDLRFGQVVYDSNEFQFWGSQQYADGIPLVDSRSYAQPRWRWMLVLPTPTMRGYRARAAELNASGQGDSACFYLHKD